MAARGCSPSVDRGIAGGPAGKGYPESGATYCAGSNRCAEVEENAAAKPSRWCCARGPSSYDVAVTCPGVLSWLGTAPHC